jgi:hypothetical protein
MNEAKKERQRKIKEIADMRRAVGKEMKKRNGKVNTKERNQQRGKRNAQTYDDGDD